MQQLTTKRSIFLDEFLIIFLMSKTFLENAVTKKTFVFFT